MELCPVCGADLISEGIEVEDNTREAEDFVIENPQLAVTVEDVVSAEIFMDILKENGIPFISENSGEEQSLQVIFGGGFMAEKIYVGSEDLEKTKELYKEFLNSEAELFNETEGDFEEE